MAKVTVNVDRNTNEKESVESLLKRFKKQVLKDDILFECKKRQYFKSKSAKRLEKSILAQKRANKKKKY